MPRHIKGSWLDAYMEWTLPRIDAPESIVKWAGIFTLAAVMKRKVCFPESLMGSYSIYPNLYIVFIADPGVVRKSVTAGFAQKLLNGVIPILEKEDKIIWAPDVTSYSKLLEALDQSPDSSLTIVASEFASLVQVTPDSTYQILADIFDNKPVHRWHTFAHGDHDIENPVINLLGAATPDWLAKQPPEYIVGGGLASRVIFVHEEKRRFDKMYYNRTVDMKKINEIGAKLVLDLRHIASLEGDFSHDTRKTEDYCEAWYQKHAKKEVADKRLKGFAERKHMQIHKVAMLLSLAERDDRKVTKIIWDKAVKLLDDVERKLPRAFSSMGTNPLGWAMDSVYDFICEKGPVELEKIADRFRRDLTLEQLQGVLSYLIVGGKVVGKGPSKMNPVYERKTS